MITAKNIFDIGLKMGTKADPRGESGVKEYLADIKKEFENAKPKDKEYFDKERLFNPYSDSRIHVDDGRKNITRVLAGIDIGEAEILLASQLGERDKKIDLVISHHPVGKSLADLHSVMDIQVAILEKAGMPVHAAEKIMEDRIQEVSRSLHPVNHYRIIDLAKLLQVNLMNIHTVTDNLVKNFLRDYLNKIKPRLIGDLIDCLMEIPEYQEAKRRGAGPCIFSGDLRHRVGTFVLEMTGGTEPSEKIYREMSNFGISTIVGMHMKDKTRESAVENYLNVVVAGHIASDSLGMNLFLDEIEKKGVEIVPCGGLIRVKRTMKK
jgi:putative NIF3 family GTP cyclohydrolase 1 type 2